MADAGPSRDAPIGEPAARPNEEEIKKMVADISILWESHRNKAPKMADGGTSGGAPVFNPTGAPVAAPVGTPADAPAATPVGAPVCAPAARPNEEELKRMFEMFIMWDTLRNEPLVDKKTPKKRKSEPNKKEEQLKQKRAKDKAQLAKTNQQLRELQQKQKLINAKKRVANRRSKDEKDQELIRKLEAATRNSTG